jgi:hypothetical protein
MGSNTEAKAQILSVASDAALEGPLFHGALNRLKARGRHQKPGTVSESRSKAPPCRIKRDKDGAPSDINFLTLLILLRFFDVIDD